MPESDLQLLTDAAREAGKIALPFWHGDNKVWDKGRDDPVTEADFAVDTFLRESLQAARPGYAWLSEETEDGPGRLGSDAVFIVDPIDGTRAFIAGKETWAHSLAVVQGGVVTAAVVYLPKRDKLYSAALGKGAQLNGAPIESSGRSELADAAILATRHTFDDRYWQRPLPEIARHFRPSLAYRLAAVAEGRFDAMLTLRDSWEWDIAAGALIATEAGASVTDRRGARLQFNSPGAQTAGVVVGAPDIHAGLLDHLAS
ncbi:MAG: 3'(2'),5'-bisphosphate nucleotidase CysQ [Alphaproteobacteria bacterium]|nr:3'(2'),5'-bisphosphate nucleotidase CysQ [Alphaproteobacteria bacterium]NNF24428.1 3'(2'),5'-bisphosphate nucleotidase CysQ [Paracoccaceae bacterium]